MCVQHVDTYRHLSGAYLNIFMCTHAILDKTCTKSIVFLGYEFPKYSNPAGVMLNAIFQSENDIKANTGIQVHLSVGKYHN